MNKTLLFNPTRFLYLLFCFVIHNSYGQTTLIQYDFNSMPNPVAPSVNNTEGTPQISQFGLANIQYANYNSCGTSSSISLAANNWNTGDYYEFLVNTTGFSNVVFSYCNASNGATGGTNIRDFDVRYSVDNGVTKTSIIPAYSPTTTGGITSANLPTATNNQAAVYVYIYKTNNANSNDTYLVVDNVTLVGSPIPTITTFTPSSACSFSGASVIINGANFTGATAVQFNGVNATSFIVNSNTQITAILPAAATTGPISVTTSGGTGSSTTNFTVTPPPGDQTSYGASSWIGYVYASTNGGNPPSNAFTTNYVGNITQAEIFDLNLGNSSVSGPNLCNTYADNFAIRFKMNKNMPSGNYTFNVGGDDGYRLSIDGGSTFLSGINNWNAHAYQSSTQTVFLSGNTNFVLEYFENGGQSRVQFSYTYCPVFSLSGISAVATSCTNAKSSIVSLSSSSVALPIGTYSVSYTLSFNGNSVVYTAPMTITTAGSGQFSANLTPLGANNSTTIRVTNIASGSCSNSLSANNTSNTVNMYAPITPTANPGNASCSIWNARWNNDTFVSGYFLDVATSNTFSAGTYVPGFENLNVGNVIVYPITGLTPGNTYYYRVRNNNLGCGISVNSNVITFVAGGATAPTIGTITQPTCSVPTGSFTLTNFNTANYDYVFSPSAGVTRSGATVTAPPGSYTLNVSNAGCVSANTSFTIDAVPVGLATPTIGTITQPTCTIPTGTVVLSGLPSSGTWTISRSGSSSASITGTGTTTTISGLAAGSYTFTVTLASCTSAATANVPINALVTTSYNGSSWSIAPTINTRGVITNSGTIATNVDLCSCTVNTGVTATIADGVMMRLQNELVVTSTGSITFKKNSSLVQINATAANSGSIFYERETTPITNFDYTYWSSPVAGQKLIDFSPNTLGDKFLSFNSFSNSWNYEDAYNNLMGKGVGYIIRGPQTKSGQPPSTQLYRFTGAPNNGPVSLPIGAAGNSVLLGNPYPSALDADKFLDANASLIEGTIYFWTHNTSLRLASSLAAGTAGSGSYAYTSDDYAAYNRTGGVATYAAPSSSYTTGPIVSGNAPTSNIGAGQSFFGTSLAAGSVQFTNNMRVGFTGLASNSNSQFFKTTSSKKTVGTVDKNRIWIDLTNEEGAFKETLLGYITGATNAFETAFDGESYDANAFVDFYSINEDKKLTIQGRALPFDDSEIIPLGYKANIGGQFSITIRDKDGLFTTQNVYLEDKLLGTVIDLSEGTYKFTTEIGVFNDRFAIRYTSKTLGVEVVDPVAEGVYISTKNKVITVQVGTETIAAAYVYDLAGKQLFAKKAVDSNQMSISNLSAANVVLVVKVVLNNGSVVTQKIVY
ncbi:MAG: T9SS sorting signal type C domain-containing protein [Flavobacteriaceae bacterium]|nr:T9SS sorting signal type C domain-containing protein [Flavobacteriaceae bacterium]